MTIPEVMDIVIMRILIVDPGHLSMMTYAVTVSGMIGVILTMLNNIGLPPFLAEVGDNSVLTSCASVLAVDEAVMATDSCSGDPRARKILDGVSLRSGFGQDAVWAMDSFRTGHIGKGDGSCNVARNSTYNLLRQTQRGNMGI